MNPDPNKIDICIIQTVAHLCSGTARRSCSQGCVSRVRDLHRRETSFDRLPRGTRNRCHESQHQTETGCEFLFRSLCAKEKGQDSFPPKVPNHMSMRTIHPRCTNFHMQARKKNADTITWARMVQPMPLCPSTCAATTFLHWSVNSAGSGATDCMYYLSIHLSIQDSLASRDSRVAKGGIQQRVGWGYGCLTQVRFRQVIRAPDGDGPGREGRLKGVDVAVSGLAEGRRGKRRWLARQREHVHHVRHGERGILCE